VVSLLTAGEATRILAPQMKPAFRKFVALALLAWLPLQAAALPALALLCEVDPGAAHGHAAAHSHHGDHQHGDGHHSGGHDGNGSSPAGPHGCCHHFFSAALLSLQTVTATPVSGVDPTPLFHPDFFIPEQPQPPPLARLV
jgi:hypothetical protein